MWSSSGLGMEGSNVQVLIHEREWGQGEEIDHLLILANLAGEHCLSVRRDGQNDWLPVAAGSLALISTLFTWSWIDVLFIPLMSVISCVRHSPRALPKLLPVWLPVILPPTKQNSKNTCSEGYQGLLYSPAYSSKGTHLISYFKATFHLPLRLCQLTSSGIFQTNFYQLSPLCLSLSTIISSFSTNNCLGFIVPQIISIDVEYGGKI